MKWLAIASAVRDWWEGVPTEPIDEARQQRLSKSAKLQTAIEGVFVNDFNQLAQAEREAVNQYRNNLFANDSDTFGKSNSREPHGQGADSEMVICDDVRRTHITRNGPGTLQNLLTAGAVGAAAWFGADWFRAKEANETPQPGAVEPAPIAAGDAPPAVSSLQLRRLSDFPNLFERDTTDDVSE